MRGKNRRVGALLISAGLTVLAVGQVKTDQAKLGQLQKNIALRKANERSAAYAKVRAAAEQRVEKNGKTFELVGLRGNHLMFLETLGIEAAQTVSANHLWAGGSAGLSLSGQGVRLGVWDGGRVDAFHQELNGRSLNGDTASVGSHATMVAGVMAASGVSPQAIGLAFGSTVKSFDWNSDVAEMASEAAAGLLLSNHSYGSVAGWTHGLRGDSSWYWLGDTDISTTEDWQFGFYNADARDIDKVAYNAPYYLPVFAAANSRFGGPAAGTSHYIWSYSLGTWVSSTTTRPKNGGTTGYDTLPQGGQTAKNTLVVGAIRPIPSGYNSPSDVTLGSFSSNGPTDDGRIKPDLVAAGVDVYAPKPGNSYGYANGTSFAAPNATGALGLLVEHYRNRNGGKNPRAATLKALTVHTADQASISPGPTYMYGWGVLNAKKAAQVISSGAGISEHSLGSGNTYTVQVKANGSEPLKVTIAWTDPAGTPRSPSLDNPSRLLVNDLDIRVLKDGSTFLPWVLNPTSPASPATTGDNNRDNVEQVVVPSPGLGTYTIRVSAKNSFAGGSQAFSMVVTGTGNAGKASFLGRYSSGDIGIWTLAGGAVSDWTNLGSPGSNYVMRALADVNGDGQKDMIGQSISTGDVAVWIMNGGRVASWTNLGNPGAGVVFRGAADVDGDGKEDLFGQTGSNNAAIWFMDGARVKNWASIGDFSGATVVGVGDFTGDGKPDVLARYASGSLAVWHLNGAQVIGWNAFGDPGSGVSIKGVADFDGDGRADFLGQYSGGSVAIWYTDGARVVNWKDLGSPGAGVEVMTAG